MRARNISIARISASRLPLDEAKSTPYPRAARALWIVSAAVVRIGLVISCRISPTVLLRRETSDFAIWFGT